MAITVNTYPQNIDNKALFNVTTSLVEDSTHVNLRVRADIYYDGIIRASVEKPKGLADFDLGHILRSFTPGLQFPKDSGDIVKCGTAGANLITDLTGTYTTFTNTGPIVNSAIAVSARSGNSTPTIALEAGSTYLFYIKNYVNNLGGGTDPVFTFVDWGLNPLCPELIQLPWTPTVNNKSCLLMCVADGNVAVAFTNYAASNWSGELYLHKITTDVTTYGKPLTNYLVVFTEYWETALGITTAGASSLGDFSCKVLRYVYAPGSVAVYPYSSFERYVLSDNSKRFANETIKNNAVKWYSYNPLEYSLCFFTEYVELELFYSKDGGAYAHSTHPVCYEGWGAVILNVGEILSTCATSLAIYFKEIAGTTISEVITLYVDNSCIDERVVLEYDGPLGGKEYLAFEGIKECIFSTIRNFYTASKKNKKLTSANGINQQKLESRFKDMAYAQYLKGLMVSDLVKKLELSYAEPTEVTILTDSVVIDKGTEYFTNRLDIEYEH
jgi:hypothetical protein